MSDLSLEQETVIAETKPAVHPLAHWDAPKAFAQWKELCATGVVTVVMKPVRGAVLRAKRLHLENGRLLWAAKGNDLIERETPALLEMTCLVERKDFARQWSSIGKEMVDSGTNPRLGHEILQHLAGQTRSFADGMTRFSRPEVFDFEPVTQGKTFAEMKAAATDIPYFATGEKMWDAQAGMGRETIQMTLCILGDEIRRFWGFRATAGAMKAEKYEMFSASKGVLVGRVTNL